MDRNKRPPWEVRLHKGETQFPPRGMTRCEVLRHRGAAEAILVAGSRKVALGAKPGSGSRIHVTTPDSASSPDATTSTREERPVVVVPGLDEVARSQS